MNPQSLFITGTDTGVGKTLCTALLALYFQQQGVDVGVMKPIASGCQKEGTELVNEDALFLQQITQVTDSLDVINPVRFEDPITPLTAAQRENREDEDIFAACFEAYQELKKRHEIVLVEGVGGWMAPLARRKSTFLDCSDLAKTVDLPVVVVARRNLGTINHSLLTCRAISPQVMLGWIFCDSMPIDSGDIAAQTGPDLISQISGQPILGKVPFLQDLSRERLLEVSVF